MNAGDLLKDPGVQGLAQLGRNAIDIVAELKRENERLSAIAEALGAVLRRIETSPAEESAFIAAVTRTVMRERHGFDI